MSTTIVTLDLDCLIAAIDAARLDCPSKRLESAYEWLVSRTSVTFDADGRLIVDSATWSDTRYHVGADGCDCPAHKPCWHLEAYALVQETRENEAIDAAAQRDAATPSLNWHINTSVVTAPQRAAHRVSYRAAVASGISDLFA